MSTRSTPTPALDAADHAQLAAHGIDATEAERQIALLRDPPPPAHLDRPCRRGDGIHVLEPADHATLTDRADEAAGTGRVSKMVPASGAASRMFKSLLAGDSDAIARLRAEAPRLPFHSALVARLGRQVDDVSDRALLDALLSTTDGLGLAAQAKGLLPFHRYETSGAGEDVRSAFVEHLVEAAGFARDQNGLCRIHVTVGPEHRSAFEAQLATAAPVLAAATGAELDVRFSSQSPATDTLALDQDGAPFRRADGRLLLRPGGHGALLRNLEATEGDLVAVRNIDNVLPENRQPLALAWRKLLIGYAAEVHAQVTSLLTRLGDADDPGATTAAAAFVDATFGTPAAPSSAPGQMRQSLIARLDRPLRVCGMVRNEGEPGGGPFWVRDATGQIAPQIVESAQIDLDDPTQRAVVDTASHFNPVDLVCALRGPGGASYALDRFVDPATVFISDKSEGGRPLRALEHPGLWNGAMAGWNTIFVEVPAATFAPVKTVFDLLRPEHRPAGRSRGLTQSSDARPARTD